MVDVDVLLDLGAELYSSHLGHHHVAYDNVRLRRERERQGFRTVGCLDYAEIGAEFGGKV